VFVVLLSETFEGVTVSKAQRSLELVSTVTDGHCEHCPAAPAKVGVIVKGFQKLEDNNPI